MQYDKQNFLKDFINRTLINLEYIQQAEKQGKEVYEVTQLVNSCLGLIVFLQQYGDELITDADICPIFLKELKESVIENTYTKDKKKDRREANFNNILYHLRNAISHGKLDFKNEEHNGQMQICSIEFEDKRKKEGKTEKFIIKLSIEQIEKLAKCIIRNLRLLCKKVIGKSVN